MRNGEGMLGERLGRMVSWNTVLTFVYVIGIVVVFFTLTEHPDHVWRLIYFSFVPVMLLARFNSSPVVKNISAFTAISILVIGGVLSPLHVEVIEESFIFVPLMVLILYPGKVWAMVAAVFLLFPYFFGFENVPVEDLIEDCIEILLITGFASVMTMFQQRSHKLMLGYREESRTDYLTNLENRLAYSNALKWLDSLSVGERKKYILLLIDLDDFKRVNDFLGHHYGDILLKQFAQRLESIDSGRTYRIGGDEFAILIDESESMVGSRRVAELIQVKSLNPYRLLNRTVNISASIGIASFNEGTESSEDLVRNADLALYQAKVMGKNNYIFFEQAMLDSRQLEDRIASDIGQGIADDQFFLVYQPKVDMRTGQMVGAEALLRWRHPELGLVTPDKFIPVAESTRQILPLGKWVLEHACMQISSWKDAGVYLPVSVNVSAVQLEHDDMLGNVRGILSDYEIEPELLGIEITETSIMDNVEIAVSVLEKIRDVGVAISVDDFGVAYSSLNQLVRLPLNILKIDKSFVDSCHSSQRDRKLVSAIIQLGRNLNMDIVAEGVELESQKEVLLEEGCFVAQGFYFHRPLDGDGIKKLAFKSASVQGKKN